MNIRIRSLALAGLMAAAPLVAAPPPPTPPSDDASAPEKSPSRNATQPQRQQQESPDPRASATTSDSRDDDVALRGPLHEAFARPVSYDPVRFPVIDRQPPEPIEEIPPEYRPDGDNIIWIPGYWSYEEFENDFLWISGLWRDVPPGRRWIPGYWSEAEGGYVWTPGEWVGTDRKSISYLDEPPRSQERGPSSDPPSADHFWIPGCWEYHDSDYAWRPGYWAVHQPNWVWIPAHYHWTPNGYVYCEGYWDYDIDQRGIVYAPYRYRGRRIANYTPRTALDVSHLLLHLFVDNRTGGYYFGDYYGRSAFRPWYSYHNSRRGYDPIFAYNAWRHGDIDYRNRLTGWNTYFTRHENFRPRATLQAQQQFLRQAPNRQIADQVNIARAVTDVVGSELFGRRVVNVSGAERESVVRTAGALLSLADRRLNVEARDRGRARSRNRNSTETQGRVDVDVDVDSGSLELPEITGPGSRNDRRRDGRIDAPGIPDLPGLINGRPGNREGQRPDRTGGNGNARGRNGSLPEIIRGSGRKAAKESGNAKDGAREIIRDGAGSVLGSDGKKPPKSKPKSEADPRPAPKPEKSPKAEPTPGVDPKPQPKPEPQPQPKVDPKPKPKPEPQPKVDPTPQPDIPDVKKPKKAGQGNRGGGKPKGKQGGVVPSIPGLK